MKRGLILEGGAMRGMFTAGVMDVMMEHGIDFDGVIGVSAGAAFGCNYKSGQIGRVIRYNTRFCADKRYGGLGVLLREGNIFSTPFCYEEVPLKHDVFDFDAYDRNPMEFYVVCTDTESGKAVYERLERSDGEALHWLRASASMPLVSTPVVIGDKKLLDGGIADSVPVRYFESLGYDRNIIVLTQPNGYQKKKNNLLPLMKAVLKQYPAVVEAMARRHTVYNETLKYIEKLEKGGHALVIRPPQKLEVRHVEHNADRLQAAYDIGRQVTLSQLDEIKEFLK